jgi:biotin transporter BioY
MRELVQRYRPRLKWYHYLVVLYLGLPVGEGVTGGPYITLGGVLGGFAAVWLVVAGIRRVRTGNWQKPPTATGADDA